MSGQPYADAWQAYWDAGWRRVLCMPPGEKSPPPTGFTAGNGTETSWADCFAWSQDWARDPHPKGRGVWRGPGGNVALGMDDGIIGIDVDAYRGKTGAATIAEATTRWGALPATWRCSAREDGSGIQFYRVPAGTRLVEAIRFPELGIGHVEIVQRGHRYAVVAPSLHPETRTPYRWRRPDGTATSDVPHVGDPPPLPSRWLTELAADTHRAEAWAADGAVAGFLDGLLDGGPCERVANYLADTIAGLHRVGASGSRHDLVRGRVLGLLRLGERGHYGAPTALQQLRREWVQVLAADPHRKGDPWGEFKRMVYGSKGIGTILAEPTPEPDRVCLCPTGVHIVLDQIEDPALRADLAAFLGVPA